jgi:uncharacterized protein YciI
MQFLITGLDGTDGDAPARRQAVRQDHIAMGDKLLTDGKLWYGAALLHDDGSMKGSMYMVDFDSEEELNKWLEVEPYVVGDVWRELTIYKCNTRDPWQFNRSEEWFAKRGK